RSPPLEPAEELHRLHADGRLVRTPGDAGWVMVLCQAQVALVGDDVLLRAGRVRVRRLLVHVDDAERALPRTGRAADAAGAVDLHGVVVEEGDRPDRAGLQARRVQAVHARPGHLPLAEAQLRVGAVEARLHVVGRGAAPDALVAAGAAVHVDEQDVPRQH